MDITIVGNTVTAAHAIHHCATRRVAELQAARLDLIAHGWRVGELSSQDRPRRPLKLPGERMMTWLDGSLADERAQGLVAWRGPSRYDATTDEIVVDACAGLPLLVLSQRGEVAEALAIVRRWLG